MAAPRKVALWSLALAALGLGLAVALAHALTDEASLKAWLQEHVRRNWQRELQIEHLSWSVLPRLALHGQGVTLSNPAWAHDKSLLKARELNLHLEWLPLLNKRMVADRLTISNFHIDLEEDAQGRQSWSLPPKSAKPGPERPLTAAVQVRELELRHGSVDFRNREGEEKRWQVEQAGLKSGQDWRNLRFDVKVARDGEALHASGKLDDASRAGDTGAATEGEFTLQAGPATLRASGLLPLSAAPQRYAFDLTLDAPTLEAARLFVAPSQLPRAPLKASLRLEAQEQVVQIKNLDLSLGKMHAAGEARIDRRGATPEIDARLAIDRLDWVQVRHDAGFPPLLPKPKGELFFIDPLPWDRLAEALSRGRIQVRIGSWKLRSGTELANVSFDAVLAGPKLDVPKFNAQMLGGALAASAVLDGKRQAAHVKLDLRDAQLGNWLAQTGKKTALSGGRMQVRAELQLHGLNQKALAASATGPLAIDMGSATLHSKKLGEAEVVLVGLTPFFSAKGADQVDLRCASAFLPFKDGVARGDRLVGLRSEASQILAGGAVDLRNQALDLHGAFRARAGITLGVSSFADKLKMEGKMTAPQVSLDKSNLPGALAKVAAAVFTGGASLVGTAIWDGVQATPNPCEQVLAATPSQIKPRPAPPRHNAK